MTHYRIVIIATVVLLAMLFISTAAAAPALQLKFKDINVAGATETDTYEINNKNVIAGDYVDASNVQHAMLLKGTNLTTADRSDCLPDPGGAGIQFFGVNNLRVAVGWCTNTSGVQIGFRYGNGTFRDIKIAGALLVNANGINDAGAIVGSYIDANGVQHGFLKVGKTLTKLDPPGVVSTATAFGINNNGVVTVYGIDVNGTYVSFTTADKGKTYTPFHAPNEGSIGTAIHHININGDIIATVFDPNSNRHAVLFFNGSKYKTFDDPNGANTTRGVGINDTRRIVGRYSPASGTPPSQGFLAVPQ